MTVQQCLEKLKQLEEDDYPIAEKAALAYGQAADVRDHAYAKIEELEVEAEAHEKSTHWVKEMTGVASSKVSAWRKKREEEGRSPQYATLNAKELDHEMSQWGLVYSKARRQVEEIRALLIDFMRTYDGKYSQIAELAGVATNVVTTWRDKAHKEASK